jgi:hypothetical protein
MSQGELAQFLDDLLAFRVHSALVKIVPLHVRIRLRKDREKEGERSEDCNGEEASQEE